MNPEELRAAVDYLDACLDDLHTDAEGNVRTLNADEQTRFDEGFALREQHAADLVRHAQIAEATQLPNRTVPGDQSRFNFNKGLDPEAVANDRSATPAQLRDAVVAQLAERVEVPENMAHTEAVVRRHVGPLATYEDKQWARSLVMRAGDTYTRAFAKYLTGKEMQLDPEERAALTVGTTNGASAGLLLPTHLDPTLILTNAGSSNAVRGISRVATLGQGFTTWNGVTSAGVTASVDGEVVEVSDDSPTFARKSVSTFINQAFVQASIASFEDVAGLQNDVMMLFADARDRLEGQLHVSGTGSSQPNGVFHAIHAVTASRLASTTAATIGLVDIHGLYRAVPLRWRNRGTWMANPLYTLAIKALGTALSASYSTNLTEPVTERILGKPLVESDDAPTTQTTTALDDEVLYGDFSQYLIVDKPGGMSVEFIPHLFNLTTNLPDGRRGWFAYWRNGADALVTSAFALLVDTTTA